MDFKIIESLLALMDEGGLSELVWEKDDLKVRLSRKQDGTPMVHSGPAHLPTAPAPHVAPSVEDTGPSKEGAFCSPLVGTFYRKPNPDTDNFVEVGDTVKAGAVLCIIEAMKVFNEIQAEEGGIVEEIFAEDGEAVEFDQPLFRIRKG